MTSAARMEPRTADTAVVAASAPTSRAPASAVTSVVLTRFSTPTDSTSPPLIAL